MKKYIGTSALNELTSIIKSDMNKINNHTHNLATSLTPGFMSSNDKIKIDGIAKCLLRANTLKELVESIMGNTDSGFRTCSGNISVASGILSFVNNSSGDWIQFWASWQNHYSNTVYDINMNAIMVASSNSNVAFPYTVHIEGKNGEYHIVSEEPLIQITKSEVDELKKSVADGKTLVANAVSNKGITTATDETFENIASNISKIKTSPILQNKTVTLSTTAQTIKPDSNYDGISEVSVPAIVGTAAVGNVLTGKTFNSATAGINKTGTMANKSSTTTNATASQDATYAYLTIPANGFYNTNSKLRTAINNIKAMIADVKTGALKYNVIVENPTAARNVYKNDIIIGYNASFNFSYTQLGGSSVLDGNRLNIVLATADGTITGQNLKLRPA